MAEYGKEQGNQLSRGNALGEPKGVQLRGIIDKRNSFFIQRSCILQMGKKKTKI